MRRRTLFSATAAAVVASTMGAPSFAQGLEEVVVTAQKREESMQDVPIAVSAVIGEQFEATHQFTLEALSATIPNVQIGHFANTPHNAVFNIRGVGAPIEPDPYAGTTVSIVVDGVPQYYNMMALLDMFDVERVEVLKGPQGTLFGANTTGGVVNVVTRKPTGEYGGNATMSVGNYNRQDASLAVDFPIIENQLAGKLAIMHHGQDGFYTNVVTGEPQGDVDTTGIRGYLRWMGSEDFDATLSYEHVISRNGSPAIVNASSPGELQSGEVLGYTRGEVTDDLIVQAGGFYMETDYTHVQNYNMNQFAQGLRQLTTNNGDNYSASAFAQAYYLLSEKLRLQAGIRYTHEQTDLDVAVNYFLNFTFDDAGNITGTAPSMFGGDTPFPLAGDITASGSDSWDEVGGKLGLDYQLDDDVMLYGFWARGFKSGGFVGRITIAQDIGPYDPEYVDSYEVGLKSELFDRTIRLNLAAFYNDYTDQQISSIYRYEDENGVSLNGNSILNAASSTIYGFDAELVAAPTDNLTINASLAYLSAEYDEFDYIAPDGNTYDLNGESLQNAPEWGGSISAIYEAQVGPGTMTSNIGVRYQDTKYYTAILNTPRSEIQATTFVDASVDWTPDSDQWTISLWARNLADKRYISVSYDSPGYAALVGYHNPREVGGLSPSASNHG